MPNDFANSTDLRTDPSVLASLVEISHDITSTLDLDQLRRKIADFTNKIIPYQIFAIFLVDDSKPHLYYRFGIGHEQQVVHKLYLKFGEGLIGTAAKEQRTVVVDDVLNDPRYIEVVKSARSELAMPLIVKGRVVGVLDI